MSGSLADNTGSGRATAQLAGVLARYAVLLLASCLLPVSAAQAIGLEKLLMPGDVSAAHADIEGDCNQCHQRFKKADQTALCLDCHTDVRDDIDARTGYHGRDPAAAGNGCVNCHTEHEGRQADIVGFNVQLFNHRLTDFSLDGAHISVECRDCHQPRKPFREAPGACIDCHRDDDTHAGGLGTACADCHTTGRWTTVNFDHDNTDYPLLGFHRDVECQACHTDNQYTDTPSDCVSCHRDDDPHAGKLGDACTDCHSETSRWTETTFLHDDTQFPLLGSHVESPCLSCHLDQTFQNTPTDCAVCHEEDDVHQGSNGQDCQRCHTETDWKDTSFNHDRDTDFRLTGAHRGTDCQACHSSDPYRDTLATGCNDCHVEDDVHRGGNGVECQDCHTTTRWEDTSFDHYAVTQFALNGAHARLECQGCHGDDVHAPLAGTGCIDCHREDDPHAGSQGNDCQQCHVETDWKQVVGFDHDYTEFPLLGRHADASCGDCHESKDFHGTPSECYACHRDDDVHDGRFSQSCGDCHNPLDWAAWRFDHDRQTGFALTGGHADAVCQDCHTASGSASMAISSTCISCHAQDDVHDGEFGRGCDRCHNTTDFRDLEDVW